MAEEKCFGLSVLAVLALVVLPEPACCHLDPGTRALPPVAVCASEGRLPDPTDCSYYMDCTSSGDGTFKQAISPCPVGKYYDPCQGDCSRTEPTADCSVTCDAEESVIISSLNPSVYFVCFKNGDVWNVNVSRCDGGKAQDSTNNCDGEVVDCAANDNGSETSACNGTYYYADEKDCSVYYYCSKAGEKPDTVHCNPDEYYIAYNHSCIEFQCTSEGWFADPANCSGYYQCSRQGKDYVKTHMQCQSGSHFDSSLRACMMGECTTVCVEGGQTFECPSSGFFADPLNCSSYYYCNSKLEAQQFQCPAGSHFDSAVGGCMMGSC